MDILVRDECWAIRHIVAEMGRPQDLEILKNDSNSDVAQYAQKRLKELKK